MASRIGKYKISNKEYTLATSLDVDSYTTVNIFITGNANIGAAASDLIGFYDVSGVNQPDALTQSAYATADRTVDNVTGVSMGDLGATENTGWGASSEANFDKIGTAIDALVADNLDLRQAISALIDDLQTIGLVG